ncbi:hypothetical protein ACLOJK_025961 [Asimina triloba]
MAFPPTSLLPLLLLLLFHAPLSQALLPFRPHALVLPVSKDPATLQYLTQLNQRTPLVPVKLAVDLGGRFLWVDCDSGYVSSSYLPARCRSLACSLAKSTVCGDCFAAAPTPGCNNNTCGLFPENPFISTSTSGEAAQDVISLHSTDGSNVGPTVQVPRFVFSCAPTFLLEEGFASGAKGLAGLGRTKIALPSQLAAAFSLPRKFAICLSSNGVIFFGDEPYVLRPGIDVSKSLIYTPLLTNPVSLAGVSADGEPSSEYFIGVKSIKVRGKSIAFDKTLLSINKTDGSGGTKISTSRPYTVLHSAIFQPLAKEFIRAAEAMNVTQVVATGAFDICFKSENMASTRVGPAVPTIDLVLHKKSVVWSIFGANSIERVTKDVSCLAIVDGGADVITSIVIGGYQLENNLVQFNLADSRVGFSSSLLFRQTTCANFNFASNA